MTNLAEFQFELLPDLASYDGQVFGIGSDVSTDQEGFTPGSTDWATQDSQSGATGVTNFGRDKLLGPVWAWELHVNRDDVENALETLGKFTTAWRWLHGRDVPGEVTALRYSLAGRTRRIYGRPGKLESSPNNLLISGFAPVAVDFQATDGYTYDDVESSRLISIEESELGPTGGGFTFPLTFPYGPLPSPQQLGSSLLVGGDAPTRGIYRFIGPWTQPGIQTDDWTLSLPNYDIPVGQYVEIDTRSWANTVLVNGDASIAGQLGRRQKLSKAILKPGPVNLTMLGSSSNGTGACSVRWANAHNSL